MGMIQMVLFIFIGFYSLLAGAMPFQQLRCAQVLAGLTALPGADHVSKDFARSYELSDLDANQVEPNPKRSSPPFRFPHLSQAVQLLNADVQAQLLVLDGDLWPGDYSKRENAAERIARVLEALGAHTKVLKSDNGKREPRVIVLPENHAQTGPWISRAATFLNSQAIPVTLSLHSGGNGVDGHNLPITKLTSAPFASSAELTMDYLYALYPEGPVLSFDQALYRNSQVQARALQQEAWPVHFIEVPATFNRPEFALLRDSKFELEEIGAQLHSALTLLTILEDKQWSRLPPDMASLDEARELAKVYGRAAKLYADFAEDLYSAMLSGIDAGVTQISEESTNPNIQTINSQGVVFRAPVGGWSGKRMELFRMQVQQGQKWITAYRDFIHFHRSLWE